MQITAISDLHGNFPTLEGGDLLIIAGDLTARGTEPEYFDCFDWIHAQPYRKKILIAGNHDMQMQEENYRGPVGDMKESFEYLCDSGTEFTYYDDRFPEEDTGFLPSGKRTLKIWGSPWTLWFKGINPHCTAFTVKTDEELKDKWDCIPEDTDILVTHSPPLGILDVSRERHLGSKSLFEKFYQERLKCRLHIFGHIHEGYGKVENMMDCPHTIFANASHVDVKYRPVNKPIKVNL